MTGMRPVFFTSLTWTRHARLVAVTAIALSAACAASRVPTGDSVAPNPAPSADRSIHRQRSTATGTPPVALTMPDLQPRLGEPLNGLTEAQLKRFHEGKAAFNRVIKPSEGLGPIHNLFSCGACHSNPVGGAGGITVTLFGRVDETGFDPLEHLGGPLLQGEHISEACAERVPPQANVIAHRMTTPTLGSGLVEAIPDHAIAAQAAAANARYDSVSGRVHWVKLQTDATSDARHVGRFGWKSQIATVLGFSAAATVNELGLTNRFFPTEPAPNGNTELMLACDEVPDPEDRPNADGRYFIDQVTDFQRYLAPPPQTPRSDLPGEEIFNRIECAACHVRSFKTKKDDGLESAIADQTLLPYSDFLLHDMGSLGDGIVTGQAQQRELRTTPLWGFRIRFPVLHDGRIAGSTLTERAHRAILAHTGEAARSTRLYQALPADQRELLIAFLDSLGRVEFDHDGDNDVDALDVAPFCACLTGINPHHYAPSDRCSLSDVDQDGDVDLADYSLFQRAFSGSHYGSAMVVP